MSFELKPHHELLQLLTAGAGFTLKASLKPQHELLQLATAAKSSGARLTLTGLGLKPQHELLQLGTAGKGVIIIEA
jgi:hypothetical protein